MLDRVRRWLKRSRNQFPRSVELCDIDSTCTFAYPERLSIGHAVHIGPHTFVECKGGVKIGDGTIISANVGILSSTHDYRSMEAVPYGKDDKLGVVTIGRAVWIGYGALILPGTTLGDGCVVGAGAVVTRDVAEGSVVGGNPCRVIGGRQGEEWRRLIEEGRFRLRQKDVR